MAHKNYKEIVVKSKEMIQSCKIYKPQTNQFSIRDKEIPGKTAKVICYIMFFIFLHFFSCFLYYYIFFLVGISYFYLFSCILYSCVSYSMSCLYNQIWSKRYFITNSMETCEISICCMFPYLSHRIWPRLPLQ